MTAKTATSLKKLKKAIESSMDAFPHYFLHTYKCMSLPPEKVFLVTILKNQMQILKNTKLNQLWFIILIGQMETIQTKVVIIFLSIKLKVVQILFLFQKSLPRSLSTVSEEILR